MNAYRVPTRGAIALERMDSPPDVLHAFYRQLRCSPEIELPSALAACEALRWRDWMVVQIPRTLVAMGFQDSATELALHPFRDSSGMACHRRSAEAVEAAVMEFVERQTWIARWLGGGVSRLIDPVIVARMAPRWQSGWTWSAHLLDAGLGAYTVFATGACAGLRVCGMATRLGLVDAMAKALIEADHCRAFLPAKRAAVSAGRPGSQYERSAMAFVSQPYPDRIACASPSAVVLTRPELESLPLYELSQVRARILGISPYVYLYLAQETGLLGRHALARVVSPDFYAHADPGESLNVDNPFAASLGITSPLPAFRTSTCLP